MTVRWGIAGTGRMAELLLGDFPHASGAELVAVGSRDAGRAAAFGEKHGIARAGTYRDLIADPGVDVIHIATPHPQHHALALAAIEAGKPVVVEKAFTATLAGAEEIVRRARERDVFCMEAMWTRFLPAVVRARELVAAGAIGEVRAVQADLGAHRTYDPADRLFAPDLGGGALLDVGVYAVSMAQAFLGRPDSVRVAGRTYPNGSDATVSMLLQHTDGRSAGLFASLECETPGRAVIAGTEGSIELEPRFHHPRAITLRQLDRPDEHLELAQTGRGYVHQIDAVSQHIRDGLTESPTIPLDDTLDVQWVLQQSLEQLGITPREAHTP